MGSQDCLAINTRRCFKATMCLFGVSWMYKRLHSSFVVCESASVCVCVCVSVCVCARVFEPLIELRNVDLLFGDHAD